MHVKNLFANLKIGKDNYFVCQFILLSAKAHKDLDFEVCSISGQAMCKIFKPVK